MRTPGQKSGWAPYDTPRPSPGGPMPNEPMLNQSAQSESSSVPGSEEVPQIAAGQLLAGKYRLDRFLAGGGMGEVYEACHVRLQSRVAIKVLRRELASRPRFLKRLEREACIAARLEHEHVARVLDIETEGNQPFIVMEYVTGETLWQAMRRGPMPCARVIELGVQLTRALGAAHDAGIIHRDLKPANIMLTRRADGSDAIKVLDFGLARPVRSSSSRITAVGAVVGTPHYMAPEQARGEETADERADIYSLGTILYEMFGGRKAHPGDSCGAAINHVLSQSVEPLRRVRPDLPEGVCAAVQRALAFDPAQRFENMDQLRVALEGCAEALRAGDADPTCENARQVPSTLPTATAIDPVQLGVETTRLPRWRRGLTRGLVLLSAVCLGFVGARWIEGSGWTAPPDTASSSPSGPAEFAVAAPPVIVTPTQPARAKKPGSDGATREQPQTPNDATTDATKQRVSTDAAPSKASATTSSATTGSVTTGSASKRNGLTNDATRRVPAPAPKSREGSTLQPSVDSQAGRAEVEAARARLASATMGTLIEALRRLREMPVDDARVAN